ncbi:MAG: hypothetical protein KAS32_25565 [Candidatus Peribacteraceae bacterium]|nr:hypothetical protein [Candidatus Peribacteraceae bacterium]
MATGIDDNCITQVPPNSTYVLYLILDEYNGETGMDETIKTVELDRFDTLNGAQALIDGILSRL